ncbi:MAG: hypothetical protein JWQ10_3687 [Herbaspirillum sp.]|nr:hypothetical protein [Herbaspirillum sp.]
MTNIAALPQSTVPSYDGAQTHNANRIGNGTNENLQTPGDVFLELESRKSTSLPSAAQRANLPLDQEQLLSINATCARLSAALMSSNEAVNLSLSQACMEAQRTNAWALVNVAAQEGMKHGGEAKVALTIDHLREAMAIEAAIASAATTTLQAAQSGMIEIDAATKNGLEAQLVRFLQATDRLAALPQDGEDEIGMAADPESYVSSAAAQQLEAWSRNSDIGTEIMRLYMNALIRMRESMRESRQLALAFYSVHAEAAVTALKKQGMDNWKKEILSAVGLIVSGVLQVIPFALAPFRKNGNGTHNEDGTEKLTHVNSEKSSSKLSKTEKVQVHCVNEDSVKGNKSSSSRLSEVAREELHRVNKGSKKLQSDTGPSEEDTLRERHEVQKQHNELLRVQNDSMLCRALGEMVQGIFNIGSAFCGFDAANDGVEHFSQNAEMQKQIFQRDKWSVEVDMMTRSMEQVASTINDLQARQSDTIVKLTGRV